MWLVTKYGFYSVVAHRDDPDLVLVRGRNETDLEHLRGFGQGRGIQMPEIVVTPEADYGCRIFLPRADWNRLGAALAVEIDYTNFKEQVHGDPLRDAAYLQVWDTMRRFQWRKLSQMYYCPTHRYNPPPNSGMAFCPECELLSEVEYDMAELYDGDADEDDVFSFLDELRDSGVTNMFGARPYLQETFGFDRQEAGEWLTRWMETYASRHGLEEA